MLIVEQLTAGWTATAVASALGTSPRTMLKWRDRFATEGDPGLRDRSSCPHRRPARLPVAAAAEIETPLRAAGASPALQLPTSRPAGCIDGIARASSTGRLSLHGISI